MALSEVESLENASNALNFPSLGSHLTCAKETVLKEAMKDHTQRKPFGCCFQSMRKSFPIPSSVRDAPSQPK